MTRRILLGFLGVLTLVIIAVVVPLGVIVSAQQGDDFRAETRSAVHAIAAVAEEHLDDNAPLSGLNTVIARFAADGDRVTVLDNVGRVVTHAGAEFPATVLGAARAGHAVPSVEDSVVATTRIGDQDRALGVAILVRDRDPLDHRRAVLWMTLLVAAAATLAVGALVGWSLGRWITRPLTLLARAAEGIGHGDATARAAEDVGPPQVREVGAAFNTMADRVTALLEAQRAMTAEVSHQLRTPLAALRLRLELLAGEVRPEHADDVVAVVNETNRLARLVDGLLAVARAEASPSAPEAIDMATLAADRVEAWRPVAAERDIELVLATSDAAALATPGHTEQILDNLIDNAIEAVPRGGTITVGVRHRDDAVSISVADNGPGMPADRRAHALDRFVTGRGGEGGTGLGLAVVHRLASADHGRVELTETVGGGLTVTITLPSTAAPPD